MDDEDRDRLEMVKHDLLFLSENTSPSAGKHQLRRVSVDMHKLLLEQQLQKAWRSLGFAKSPMVMCPRPIELPSTRNIIHHQNSFANTGNISIGDITFIEGTMTDHDLQDLVDKDFIKLFPVALNEFVESAAMIIKGKKIKRRQIIQYEALKRGGKHFDVKRDKKDADSFVLLDEIISSDLKFGGTVGSTGQPLMDGLDPVSFELLSIGQLLSQSPDIQSIIRLAG